MRELTHKIETDGVHLYCLWDWHVESAFCREASLDHGIKMALNDPLGLVIVGGDTVECIVSPDVRVDDSCRAWKYTTVVDAKHGVKEKLKPLADAHKISHIHIGNHELTIIKKYGDFVNEMCDELGVKYAGWSALTHYQFPNGSATAFTTHGAGFTSSTSDDPDQRDAVLKRFLERKMRRKAFADYYIMGHCHQLRGFAPAYDDVPYLNDKGEMELLRVKKKPFFGVAGSFLAVYDDKRTKSGGPALSYAEKNLYDPLPIGFLMIEINERGEYVTHHEVRM